MQRVMVIGVSGSGKSTFAAHLAARSGLPYVATDPLYWGPNWRRIPLDQVHCQAEMLTAEVRWILDGNFDDARSIIWARADTIIWLNYGMWVVLPQLLRRNATWVVRQTRTWSGNTMTSSRAWSGMRHCLRTYWQKRRDYPGYLAEFPHARVLCFHSPSEAQHWLADVPTSE